MDDDYRSRAPWSSQPSLKAMVEEIGVNFDTFIKYLAEAKADAEIASEFAVTEKAISNLREHFERYGVHSIIGQD